MKSQVTASLKMKKAQSGTADRDARARTRVSQVLVRSVAPIGGAVLREGDLPLPEGDGAFEAFVEGAAGLIRAVLLERAKAKEAR